MLQVQDLQVSLGRRVIIQRLGFSLAPGQLVGLIGPNGAGKTTLLRALVQLLDYSGVVRLQGEDARRLGQRERAQRLAYLAQGHSAHWSLPVPEVVALGRLPHRRGFSSRLSGQDQQAIERALHAADCLAFVDRRIDQLSGGERARVMLARALAVEAPVLLCDEPVASLDPYHQLHIMAMLRRHAEAGAVVVCVLHDLTWAGRFCHRLLLLQEGNLVADGGAAQVLSPENLAQVYQISAITGVHADDCYLLPWQCLATK